MLRFWLCLILVLFAPQAGSLSGTFSAEVCTQRCADDDEQGQCAPDCTDCACCSHVVRPLAVMPSAGLVQIAPEAGFLEWEECILPSIEPGEILHVPIVLLA